MAAFMIAWDSLSCFLFLPFGAFCAILNFSGMSSGCNVQHSDEECVPHPCSLQNLPLVGLLLLGLGFLSFLFFLGHFLSQISWLIALKRFAFAQQACPVVFGWNVPV